MRRVRREKSSALRPIKWTWLKGINVSLLGQDWLSAPSTAMPASGHDDAQWDCTRRQLFVARTSTLLAVRGWAAVRASMTVPEPHTQPNSGAVVWIIQIDQKDRRPRIELRQFLARKPWMRARGASLPALRM